MKTKTAEKTTPNTALPPAVNFHITKACNFHCKFCFARFNECNDSAHCNPVVAKSIIAVLAKNEAEKITFSGGEPLLYPHIIDVIKYAKECGLTTMMVTNGSMLTPATVSKLSFYLDWIGVSVDSNDVIINNKLGRVCTNRTTNYQYVLSLIKQSPIKLKINTVVCSENWDTTQLSEFINWAQPERWKIMQAITINGQNEKESPDFSISERQYLHFINQNKVSDNIHVVTEYNQDMISSYVMINPDGCFFSNKNNMHKVSRPIIEVGLLNAFNDVHFSMNKFLKRDGLYDWSRKSGERQSA